MTDDLLLRLREDCPSWTDERLAKLFSRGSVGFASPEAWQIVRSETLKRGLATDAMARALESRMSVDDPLASAYRITKGWSRITWFIAVAVVGALVAAAAMMMAGSFN